MSSARMFLRLGATLYLARLAAAYTLQHTSDKTNFLDDFNFENVVDPTKGYVNYVTKNVATSGGLAKIDGDAVYLGVDTTPVSGGNRKSIRLSSKAVYTHGLFIADIAHMPDAPCGLWPAFWTFGPEWPNNGEIDIIEGVNTNTANTVTLHSSPGCIMGSEGTARNLGITSGGDCSAGAGSAGCGIRPDSPSGYGKGFNDAKGGVYAMEWTSKSISVWQFPRSSIPGDISSGSPNPQNWGAPTARFNPSGCNIDSHFNNHNIIINTDFCGSWAGDMWGQQCAALTKVATCEEYVDKNGEAFVDAYWLFNYIKIYQ